MPIESLEIPKPGKAKIPNLKPRDGKSQTPNLKPIPYPKYAYRFRLAMMDLGFPLKIIRPARAPP